MKREKTTPIAPKDAAADRDRGYLRCYSCFGLSRQTTPCARSVSQMDPCPSRMLSPPGPVHCCTTAFVAGEILDMGI